MSIALVIEQVNEKNVDEYLPISGQRFFKENWLPLCLENGLRIVPMFETGGSFDEGDLPELLAELEVMKRALSVKKDKDPHLSQRLNLLENRLKSLVGKKVQLFIG